MLQASCYVMFVCLYDILTGYICNSCNMGISGLPDMYAQSPVRVGVQCYVFIHPTFVLQNVKCYLLDRQTDNGYCNTFLSQIHTCFLEIAFVHSMCVLHVPPRALITIQVK